ncbi:FGGY-family carbohydrate kinase [Jannaschia aquimarina]|uniref:AraB_1 protein n=1 Tax=Jannaschia aquimarina TaxID=935700 RepID=A0A0D1EB01_9RHOB|nr:FGGY family carbohydrate kinase [Jannaschia aquimarina]KIT14919.1 Ribulokinase [Jannaschia aquimarina]SNS59333.1 Ribulose kinase [Jannaschia aquimarina]
MTGTHVIGIDGGTEGLRARVFDLTGRSLGDHSAPYETDFPAPGRAEQDPDAWWRACGEAVRGAVAASGVDTGSIAALACDTTSCTVVALDEDGAPLRPCLLWMDVRAHEEAADILATGDPALRVNGAGAGPLSPEWMLPKALWIKRNQPDILARATKVGEYQDFLTFRLTGRWCASLNNLTMRWHYQTQHGGWPDSLLARLDLSDLREKWPSDIAAPGEVVGPLTPAAADHLGLSTGVQVVQGGADAFIGMIGLGVTQPGDLALITGSSHLQLGIAAGETHAAGVWGTYADCVYPGRPVIEGGQTSTGSIIAWFKRNFAPGTPYDDLNAAAAALPPGAEGLLAVDHFQGNRTPHTDALARGAITGLTLKHSPAHVYRALIEGVCLGTRAIVDAFGDAFEAKRIVVAGGATNAPFWLQIHADTLGLPLEITEQPEAPCLGSAILAAYGAGAFDSIDAGCAAMVRTARVIEPDMDAHAAYAPIYDRYRTAYHALKEVRE